MSTRETLTEIRRVLKSAAPIPAARLEEWLASDDVEVLGACHEILTQHFDRLETKAKTRYAVPSEYVCSRMLRFFRVCLAEGQPGEFALNRARAARSLYDWFLKLSGSDPAPLEALAAIKDMLADLYKTGDPALRQCLVASCLEHLFETRRIAEYFADWQDDPALAAAFDEALEWGRDFWPSRRYS